MTSLRRSPALAVSSCIVALTLTLGCGCSSATADNRGSPSPSGGPSGGTGSQGGGQGVTPAAGVLTAGAWDDNVNYVRYSGYVAEKDAAGLRGRPPVDTTHRLAIRVSDPGGLGVAGATVAVKAGDATVFTTTTGADGLALFFPAMAAIGEGTQLTITATSVFGETLSTAAVVGDEDAQLRMTATSRPSNVDVAIMIDTTGSMGDEIAYLRAEVDAIAASVSADFPSVGQRWALVDYKDTVDPYVVRLYDFTDLSSFRASFDTLSASGGGDYPESPEKAMAKAVTLGWRGGATARVMFWIADAPHHVGDEGTYVHAFAEARRLGVHVYPISASGTDDLLEYTMRMSAEVTGGRYLFLTDDSGVGDPHKVPEIPCYYVTHLEAAMQRMLRLELKGTYQAPEPSAVMRTVGAPSAGGICSLGDGTTATAL